MPKKPIQNTVQPFETATGKLFSKSAKLLVHFRKHFPMYNANSLTVMFFPFTIKGKADARRMKESKYGSLCTEYIEDCIMDYWPETNQYYVILVKPVETAVSI